MWTSYILWVLKFNDDWEQVWMISVRYPGETLMKVDDICECTGCPYSQKVWSISTIRSNRTASVPSASMHGPVSVGARDLGAPNPLAHRHMKWYPELTYCTRKIYRVCACAWPEYERCHSQMSVTKPPTYLPRCDLPAPTLAAVALEIRFPPPPSPHQTSRHNSRFRSQSFDLRSSLGRS